MGELYLTRPSTTFADEITAYREEFLSANSSMDGCGALRRLADPYEWIKESKSHESKDTVPENLVPATQFLYIRKADNVLVGMIQVRHYFNDYLKEYGGHIGYSVRPSERRKGYAKKMLQDCLPFCREIGLDKVLITCLKDNEGSRRTILANGGVYESTVFEPKGERYLERYWITL